MSKKLLYSLCGTQKDGLRRWLDAFTGEPRIAWYPSAGSDLRDLLYLHPSYLRHRQHGLEAAAIPAPRPPDIFLHTDYYPWRTSEFLDSTTVHLDARTRISAQTIEELPRCDLPLDYALVDFPDGSVATGRVLFLEMRVESDRLGTFTWPLVYVFAENAAFCAERMLPQGARTSHIVHVRFGGGCGGGGHSTGIWLLNVLRGLQCEVLITDQHYAMQSGDDYALMRYPVLAGQGTEQSHLESVLRMDSRSWSNHGDVHWQLVEPGASAGRRGVTSQRATPL